MNDTKIMTSLDDTKELRSAIAENPELPIVVFVGEESYSGEYSYNLAEVSKIEVKEITWDRGLCVEKEEYKDRLRDQFYDECAKAEIENILRHVEFLKAIVIYVG